jgi:hypothetical protein
VVRRPTASRQSATGPRMFIWMNLANRGYHAPSCAS